MCGLVGFAVKKAGGSDTRKFMEQCLYADQIRGADATGVGLVYADNSMEIYKKALAASDFLQTRYGEKAMKSVEDAYVCIGHNRAATMQVGGHENAHPFIFNGWMGAHNGTIHSHKSYFKVKDHSLDSANLIDSVSQADDIKDVLKNIPYGSYALTLYDQAEQQVVLARNSERPLEIIESKAGIVWGSELGLLYWILDRNNLANVRKVKHIELPVHEVWRYDCNEMTWASKEAYTPKKPVYQNATGGRGNNHVGATSAKKLSGGSTFSGLAYDEYLNKEILKAVLDLSLEAAYVVPKEISEYSNSQNKRGTMTGYLLDEKARCYIPVVLYNVEIEDFKEAKKRSLYMRASPTGAYALSDGTIVTLSGVDATLSKKHIDGKEIKALCKDNDWQSCKMFSRIRQKFGPGKDMILAKYLSNDAKQNVISFPGKRNTDTVEVHKEPSEDDKEEHSRSKSLAPVPKERDKWVPGPGGETLTVPAVMDLISDGCCCCNSQIVFDELWDIGWWEDSPVCSGCLGTKEIARWLTDEDDFTPPLGWGDDARDEEADYMLGWEEGGTD